MWFLVVTPGISMAFDGLRSYGHQHRSCNRATDPNMALSSSFNPDETMAPGDSTVHSNQLGLSGGTAFEYQHGHRFWSRP